MIIHVYMFWFGSQSTIYSNIIWIHNNHNSSFGYFTWKVSDFFFWIINCVFMFCSLLTAVKWAGTVMSCTKDLIVFIFQTLPFFSDCCLFGHAYLISSRQRYPAPLALLCTVFISGSLFCWSCACAQQHKYMFLPKVSHYANDLLDEWL